MMQRALKCWIGGAIALLCLVSAIPAFAAGVDGGVTFTDIALQPSSGIDFQRLWSAPRVAIREAIDASSPIPAALFTASNSPQKESGLPGVAIFDYDRDGDLDIYVTNGPGAANSLFQNQFANGGGLTFVDKAAEAGVEATSQDSTGVCYGDTDNDGDHDLYVVSVDGHPYHFFRNEGNGTFTDQTTGDLVGKGRNAVGCSFADVDNDGLLDLWIGNTYDDWSQRSVIFTGQFYYPGMQHNQLLINKGNNTFVDESTARGIEELEAMDGDATLSWAVASVDYDQDGDIDLMSADTVGGMSRVGVGYNRLWENDGTGNFTEVGPSRGLTQPGSWMGLAYGDYNCDGFIDFFSTNLGRFMGGPTGSSRWFLGSASKSFADPGVESLAMGGMGGTPFGWGASTIDFDNDADQDIIWYGDDDILNLIATDNPGTLIRNSGQCSGFFQWESGALRDHRMREVQGVAVGDLNNDGFDDVVSAANFQVDFIGPDPSNPCRTLTTSCNVRFSMINGFPTQQTVFDFISTAEVVYTSRINPGFLTLVPHTRHLGNLAVEINSADNGNGWAQISVLGTKGLTSNGKVNRDGIGAVLRFTPDGGKTVIHPVLGGASHASQDDLTATLGLGDTAKGTVEILWPGGTINRLYDVAAGERVRVPEIPCSVTGTWKNFGQYNSCVVASLNQLRKAGLISDAERERLQVSAARAFNEQ